MHNTTTTLISSIIYAIIGLLISMLFASCVVDADSLRNLATAQTTISYEHADLYQKGGTTLANADITALDIDWLTDSVVIRHCNGNDITIAERNSQPNDTNEMRWWKEGSTLHIQYSACATFKTNDLTKVLYIDLPKGYSFNEVKLSTVSAVTSADYLNTKNLSIESVSGDIAIASVQGENVDVESVSSNIDIKNLQASVIDFETVSGDINTPLANTRALGCQTVSGDIILTLPTGITANFETVSGDIILTTPSDFTATYETLSGTISFGSHNVSRQGKTYRCGNGTSTIKAETVSGDLVLQ